MSWTLIIALSFPVLLCAQHNSYMGKEDKLTKTELLAKAESTDFKDNISAKIHKDKKNTYFAVDANKLSNKYEKIRLLELSYTHNAIVSIGTDINMNYYFFLVNNTLNISSHKINNIFDEFIIQAKTELQTMNEEQVRLWLIQHDKYSNK